MSSIASSTSTPCVPPGAGPSGVAPTIPASAGEASGSSVGISAPRPLPSPLRRPTARLLGQLSVGDGPPGPGIEAADRLSVGRCLGQADRTRDHRAADLGPEVLANLVDDLV